MNQLQTFEKNKNKVNENWCMRCERYNDELWLFGLHFYIIFGGMFDDKHLYLRMRNEWINGEDSKWMMLLHHLKIDVIL